MPLPSADAFFFLIHTSPLLWRGFVPVSLSRSGTAREGHLHQLQVLLKVMAKRLGKEKSCLFLANCLPNGNAEGCQENLRNI